MARIEHGGLQIGVRHLEGAVDVAVDPRFADAIELAVREERILADVFLLALLRHHIDGVVQHRVAQLAGDFRHQNGRVRLATLQNGQRANVIVMRMRDENGVRLAVLQRAEIRRRGITGQLWMHAGVQDHALFTSFEKVTIGADLATAGEIAETHAWSRGKEKGPETRPCG